MIKKNPVMLQYKIDCICCAFYGLLKEDIMDFHLGDLGDEEMEFLEFNRAGRWTVSGSRQSPAYEFMNGVSAH